MAGRSIEDTSIAFIGAETATNPSKGSLLERVSYCAGLQSYKRISAGIGTDLVGGGIYHGAAGGYEGGAALYRFALKDAGFLWNYYPRLFLERRMLYGCIQPAVFL